MGNMSYCRFENTARDLKDCVNAIHNGEYDDLSSRYELNGFIKLIELAQEIVDCNIDIEEVKEMNEHLNWM